MQDNLLNQESAVKEVTPESTSPKVPEKFLDPNTGELRVEALLKSYTALEQKLSKMLPSLDDDDGRSRILTALGRPEAAEAYQIDLSHGLFDTDSELNQRLYEQGFTNEQAQMVYDIAAEKLVPMILDIASEFEADREIERLKSEFGGDDKWQEVSRQLLAYGQKNLPNDVLQGLASSYEGVMALYRMMGAGGSTIGNKAEAEQGMNEDKLKSMMSDPKYWQNKDPEFISRVTNGFKQLYGQ